MNPTTSDNLDGRRGKIGPLLNSLLVEKAAARHADRLLAAGVAGTNTSHGARSNLDKIHRLLESDPGTTFGMEGLLRGVSFDEAYGAVAVRIGFPPDHEENPDRGCIDPERTAAGLLQAGERIQAVARDGGRAVFATGHPGALLVYYLGLGRWFEELGGEILVMNPRLKRVGLSLERLRAHE